MDGERKNATLSIVIPVVLIAILIIVGVSYYFIENAKPPVMVQNPSVAPIAATTTVAQPTASAPATNTNNTTSVGIIQSSFQYPYPFSWMDTSADGGQFTYSITGVALGNVVFPPDSSYFADGSSYGYLTTSTVMANAQVVHALVLYVKIHRADNDYGPEDVCVPLKMRRLVSEEGDFASPNTTQFVFPQQGGCSLAPGISVDNQPIIFAVSSTDQAFSFDTGNASSSFFNVLVSNGAITVSPEPDTD